MFRLFSHKKAFLSFASVCFLLGSGGARPSAWRRTKEKTIKPETITCEEFLATLRRKAL